MCLGGGGSSPVYTPPQKYDPPPGPPSPADTVNDLEIAKTGDFTRKDSLKVPSKPSQSSKNTGMY
tara:strand:+ start:356 stop:550 length:195 start_codon:yes stop_codon:yes gene_type:complete